MKSTWEEIHIKKFVFFQLLKFLSELQKHKEIDISKTLETMIRIMLKEEVWKVLQGNACKQNLIMASQFYNLPWIQSLYIICTILKCFVKTLRTVWWVPLQFLFIS